MGGHRARQGSDIVRGQIWSGEHGHDAGHPTRRIDMNGDKACMRMRPASLTDAAPPSICHDIHSRAPIEHIATKRKGAAARPSLAPRDH